MPKWEKISIPFRGGVDTKSDEKTIPPTKLSLLENGIFTKRGAITKRKGYETLSTDISSSTPPPSTISTLKGMATRDRELVAFDGDKLYSYAENNDEWIDRDFYRSVVLNTRAVAQMVSEQTLADYAEYNNVAVYAWEDSVGTVIIYIEDLESGAVYTHYKSIGASLSMPRCVNVGGTILVFAVDTSNEKIKCFPVNTFDVTASLSGSAINTVHDADGSIPGYDVCAYSDSQAVLTYQTNAETIKVALVGPDGLIDYPPGVYELVPSQAHLIGPITCEYGYADSGEDDTIVVAYESNGVKVNGFRLSLSSSPVGWTLEDGETGFDTAGSDTINAITMVSHGSAASYKWDIFYEKRGNQNYLNYVLRGNIYISGTWDMFGYGNEIRHVGLGSKAFKYNGEGYVWLVHDSDLQSTYFCIAFEKLTDGPIHIIARALPGIAGGIPASPTLPNVVNNSTGKYSFAGIYKTRLDATNQLQLDTVRYETETESFVYTEKGIRHIELDFDSTEAYHSTQIGRSLYLNGGLLYEYDGNSVVESGFLLYPENITGTCDSGGNLDINANYSYRIYWEWTNAQGEREQSSFAGIFNYDLNTGNDRITLVIPSLTMTQKSGDDVTSVHLAIYRTVGDATDDLFYRVTDIDPTGSYYVPNSSGANSVTFVDDIDDDDIIDNELDYQNVGELDNIPPVTPTAIVAAKDRIFVAGGEIPENEILHSKIHKYINAAEFNDALLVKIDRAGGAVTGLAILNDNLIVFKRDHIFIVPGDGPDNLGYGGFGEAQMVSSDVGCKTQKSIVRIPDGLMFMSDKGIYLLDQQLSLSYIGADVETYNSQTITAATLIPDENQVIFLTDSGSTLMFDYFFRQWSIYTGHAGVGAVVWDDKYCYAKSDGTVYKQSDTVYTDGEAVYKLRAQTAWIKFNTLQNFARVKRAYILGDFHTDHTLNMWIGYDYEPGFRYLKTFVTSSVLSQATWGSEATWGAADYWGSDSDTVYQFRAGMPREKCEAIRFLFEEDPDNTPGQGPEITEILLRVKLKKSPFKLGSAKTL